MNKITRLPDTELEVMKAVWSIKSEINTTEIKKILDKNRPWNVSALQTLLNRLIDRVYWSSFFATLCSKKYLTKSNFHWC